MCRSVNPRQSQQLLEIPFSPGCCAAAPAAECFPCVKQRITTGMPVAMGNEGIPLGSLFHACEALCGMLAESSATGPCPLQQPQSDGKGSARIQDAWYRAGALRACAFLDFGTGTVARFARSLSPDLVRAAPLSHRFMHRFPPIYLLLIMGSYLFTLEKRAGELYFHSLNESKGLGSWLRRCTAKKGNTIPDLQEGSVRTHVSVGVGVGAWLTHGCPKAALAATARSCRAGTTQQPAAFWDARSLFWGRA